MTALEWEVEMMALEWEVERPAGTEIKTLTDGCVPGCVIRKELCFPGKCLLTITNSICTFNSKTVDEVHDLGLRLQFIMWTTAKISEMSLTVFPAHEWSHSAAAKTWTLV